MFNYFTNLYVLLCLKIFMLNARLATTESMTHDVIRDMLGVKIVTNGRGEGEVNWSVVLRYAQRAIYTRGDPKP